MPSELRSSAGAIPRAAEIAVSPWAALRGMVARSRLAVWRHALLFRLLVALAAVGGMTASVLSDLNLRASAFAGSDMKTLFASAWCFAHGQDAYSLTNVQSVFLANRVIFPQTWFAHAPVYPPTTLALLAPLTVMPMVPVIYSVIIGSSILFVFAVTALMREAARGSHPIISQLVIAVVAACCPLFSFAASMANVSIAACSLCLLAFLDRRRIGGSWMRAMGLAVAILLKPHLAIWIVTGMLLMRERYARVVAARAALVACAFSALVSLGLYRAGHFGLQFDGFVSILHSEMARGSSMSPSSHEAVPIVAQITGLNSLPGFWWASSAAQSLLVAAVVIALGGLAGWQLHRTRHESDLPPAMGAWLAFGLLATYHRAHDAMILLLLLPWLIEALQRNPRRWPVWAVLSFGVALNLATPLELLRTKLASGTPKPLLAFLLLRQAAIADLGLLLVLLGSLLLPRVMDTMRSAIKEKTKPVLSAS